MPPKLNFKGDNKKMSNKITLVLLLVLLSVSGCKLEMESPESMDPLVYYRLEGFNIKSVGRMVMLEMENLTTNQDLSSELTTALSEEIRKEQVVGLETLYRKDPSWKKLDIADSAISLKQLGLLKEKFGANAVLHGKILHYRPYPQNSIGLKLKMVDCTTGKILWAIDEVWDSTDTETEEKIKSFFRNQMRSEYGPMEWKIVTLSPRIYNKFISYEISQTLQ